MGVHGRLFGMLIRLYPAPFRHAYGAEMAYLFLHRLERVRAERGRRAVAWLWLRTTADIVTTALAERRGPSHVRTHSRPPRRPMTFLDDLRHAAHRVRRFPLFSLSVVTILAVGIGLNAAVFSVVDTLLFRPPPFAAPEEIVHIYQDSDNGDPSSTSFPAYRDMAVMSGVFAGVAATSSGGATWEAGQGPLQVSVEYTTASYFPVLGLSPQRGRWLASEHDRLGAAMVAVVTDRAWRTKMGADPAVVGRTVRLNGQPVTIIGVGPRDFNGDAGAIVTDFWLSISSTPVGGPFRVRNLERREDHWYQVKARLAPGVSVERARTAMAVLAARLGADFPELNEGRRITVFAHDDVRFHPSADGGLLTVSMGLLLVAGLVLVLACSSLANLLLMRGISRGPEMAVREALGAGRGRVVRLLLLEALLLSALGGLAGLGVAWATVRLVPRLPFGPAASLDVGFDHRVVLFGVLLSLATGLLFGLAPALRSARADVAAALRDEGRGRSPGRGVSLLRGGLVAVQVAVSLVLVVGAGLLTRSLAATERVDPGVDVERIALLGTNLVQGGIGDGEAEVVIAELLERVAAIPGVERAALTTRLPVQPGGTTTQVIESYRPPSGTEAVELPFASVSRGYFAAMGMPLLAGRSFGPDDHPDAPTAIIVNETAARVFWGGDALGGRIRSEGRQGPWGQVVGVVADAKVSDLREAPTPMIYYAAEQDGVRSFTVVARTGADPAALTGALRSALRDVRPSLPVTRLGSLEAHLGDALAGPRAAAALMGAFSLLALLLASFGVYAVVSFAVARRTQEIGIRAALGATRARLVSMVVGESLVVVAVGVAIGLALTVPVTRGLEGLLFGVGAGDGTTLGGAAILLLTAAAVAAFLPARRAARADPVEVLRQQ
ncbi:MAG TPA: ABC transporter permease [Longimicrobiales bacterium]|nr:ABC transporter permease [Longimicrobiales bacterium]